jgi:hypothetical protein
MPEELKDKLDEKETIEERRQRYDEKYPEYASDLTQAESLDDSVPLAQEWPRK